LREASILGIMDRFIEAGMVIEREMKINVEKLNR
jgi:hypothetical protein